MNFLVSSMVMVERGRGGISFRQHPKVFLKFWEWRGLATPHQRCMLKGATGCEICLKWKYILNEVTRALRIILQKLYLGVDDGVAQVAKTSTFQGKSQTALPRPNQAHWAGEIESYNDKMVLIRWFKRPVKNNRKRQNYLKKIKM